MSRIFWDEFEKQRLIETTAKLRLENVSDSLIAVLNQAQQVCLKEPRRRIVNGLQQIPWLEPEVKKCVAKISELAKKAEEAKSIEQMEAKLPQQQAEPEPPTYIPTVEEILSIASASQLLHTLADKISSKIDDISKLSSSLSSLSEVIESYRSQAQQFRHVQSHPQKHISQPKKKKVLVVGTIGPQRATLFSMLNGLDIDLRFIDSDECERGSIPNVDDCYVLTKFVSHSVQDRLRNKLSADKIHLHTHGFTELAAKIKKDLVK